MTFDTPRKMAAVCTEQWRCVVQLQLRSEKKNQLFDLVGWLVCWMVGSVCLCFVPEVHFFFAGHTTFCSAANVNI